MTDTDKAGMLADEISNEMQKMQGDEFKAEWLLENVGRIIEQLRAPTYEDGVRRAEPGTVGEMYDLRAELKQLGTRVDAIKRRLHELPALLPADGEKDGRKV